MSAIAAVLRAIDRVLESACVVLLAATVLLTVLQVFWRYVLGDALSWSEELARWCFVWSIFVGVAVVTGRQRHMRLDFARSRVGPRAATGLDYFAQVVIAAAGFALLVHGSTLVARVTGATGALEWESRYLYLAVPVGAALTLAYVASRRHFGERLPWSGPLALVLGAGLYLLFLSGTPLLPLPGSVGWTIHVVALALMFLDVPIAFCLVVAAYAAFARQGELMLMPISQALAASANSFLLLSIPFFILAAQVMNASGITQQLVRFAASLVGHLRGGLAQVNIVTNTVMGGLSGSSLAVAVGTAKVLVPEMEKRGYPRPFAASVSASASTIDNLIPPSIGFIVFASVGTVSVGALFAAGIVPGFMMALALMLVVRHQAVRRGFEAAGTPASWRARAAALREALPALLVPVMIVGGMRIGAFTASEAGAMAVVYAIVIGKLAYRRFRWPELPGILREGFLDTVSIIAIVAAAAPFGWALGIERIPQSIAEALGPLAKEPLLLLLVLNVFLLLVGLAMEFIASVVILVPILMPIAVAAGIEPVQLGVIVVMNLVLGALTPPLGVLVFATATVAKARIDDVYREVMPFLGALLVVLLLVTYLPWTSLALPRLLGF